MPVNSAGRGWCSCLPDGPYSPVRGRRMGKDALKQALEFRFIWRTEKQKFLLFLMSGAAGPELLTPE
jgi:hypothetical protein